MRRVETEADLDKHLYSREDNILYFRNNMI